MQSDALLTGQLIVVQTGFPHGDDVGMVDDALQKISNIVIEKVSFCRMARPALPHFDGVVRGKGDERIPLIMDLEIN